jgi:GntR family transcriptional regulator, rspAB operon transcriptional repressor
MKKENLKNQVYQSLKRKIINNEIAPNSYLDEKQICESLGVSRTPVREAMTKLEWENLVVPIPQHGVMVSDLSAQSITELFQVRKAIEPVLLKSAYKNFNKDVLVDFRARMEQALKDEDFVKLHDLDYEFHQYLYESCNNRHITKIMSYISDQFQRIRTQAFYVSQRSARGANEHIAIINALLNEDFDRVPDLMYQHICSTEQFYYQSLLNSSSAT